MCRGPKNFGNHWCSLSAIRVAKAYRTISYDVVCVVAGMLPIVDIVEEDARCYTSRKSANGTLSVRKRHREDSLIEWQKHWDNTTKRRWTHRFVPSIKPWILRTHGELNFHLTEFLSGHGNFKEYLHRIGRRNTSHCPACTLKDETPEHVLFECPQFNKERDDMLTKLGWDTKSENCWNIAHKAITDIMTKLYEISSLEQA